MERPFSGYELQALIYSSSRSRVYRARRISDGRCVVLKTCADELLSFAAVAHFRHELDLLRAVDRCAVVEAFEVIADGNQVALVLEDFGLSLKQWLEPQRPLLAEALTIAVKLAAAVDKVHEAAIVHRDLNPYNIVYDPASTTIKLIDFDIATRVRTDDSGFTSHMLGTLQYMAPEQTGRVNRPIDVRTDLYSLGATLYELFTGRPPFESDDVNAIVHCHLAVEPAPLDQIDPNIPRQLSELVLKLLEKSPELRYQTVGGLAADLAECHRQLQTTHRIDRFELATSDHSQRFEIPATLYGREPQIATLTAAFERIADGGVEIAVVSGPSGIGKSSVVRELQSPTNLRRGFFVAGKFDQLRRDVPYQALAEALEDHVKYLLTLGAKELASWRTRIVDALQPNAQLVIDAIPAVELVIGPQPPVAVLDASGTQNRFNLTLQRFIQLFARPEHPLVLFLDDMQWADLASIHLLKLVMTSEDTQSLLLVQAFRDNEVSGLHPMAVALDELRERRRVETIVVAPLGHAEVAAMLAGTLHRDPTALAELAEVVLRNTEGNPFFIREFLHTLYQEALLVYDDSLRGFGFNLATIQRMRVTDNVADLLAYRLQKLTPEIVRTVTTAAAIGNRFELETLAAAERRPVAAVHRALELLAEHGYVVSLSEPEPVDVDGEPTLLHTRFAFHHDRIQQAAYALLSADDQEQLHLAIGRSLVATTPAADLDDRIFDIVGQLNRSLPRLDVHEHAQLIELNRRAGTKAKASAAFPIAIASFRVATQLASWDDYASTFELHLSLAESIYLGGDVSAALAFVAEIYSCARTIRDRARLESLQMTIFTATGDMRSAVACTRRGARLYGVELPEDPRELGTQIGVVMGGFFARIASHPIESYADLPVSDDPDHVVLMSLLQNSTPSAYQVDPALLTLIVARMVALSLEHGNTTSSARGYCSLAIILHIMGRYHDAYRIGRVGVELNRRLGDVALRPSVDFVFGAFASPWQEPIADTARGLREAVTFSLHVGDHLHAAYAGMYATIYALESGHSLTELERDAVACWRLSRDVGDRVCSRTSGAVVQLIKRYRSERTPDHGTLNGDGFDEAAAYQGYIDEANGAQLFHFQLARIEHRYMIGNFAEALALADENQALIPAVPAFFTLASQRLYHCLAITATWGSLPERHAELEAKLSENHAALKLYAELCPANFEAMMLVVEAERACIARDLESAIPLYDRAIACAAKHGFHNQEALASELAARMWLARDKRAFAIVYAQRARNAYVAWGARYNARRLEQQFPETRTVDLPATHHTTSGRTNAALELSTVVKATRAISSEIVLDRLLTKMLEIILENAGAEAGAILFERDGALVVQAAKQQGSTVSTSPSASVPEGIVNYVARTGEHLVIDDAMSHARFSSDAYVQRCKSRSILCMPVRHNGRMLSVLYLENNLLSGAFTPARLETLDILVSQLAVSIENALLFATLAETNTRLEQRVVERTAELESAHKQLVTAARRAGMAEVAVGVLHNIGNVLNSVNVSAGVVDEKLRNSRLKNLRRVSDLLYQNRNDLGRFMAEDDRGRMIPSYLTGLADQIDQEHQDVFGELASLTRNIDHIKTIVTSQQSLTRGAQLVEATDPIEVMEDALRINETSLQRHGITLQRIYESPPGLVADRHQILQILVNLMTNAIRALADSTTKTITVRIHGTADRVRWQVSDTGIGIARENLDRIFEYGFTTRADGSGGFGLHTAALAAKLMKGHLRVASEGMHRGAMFDLEIPTQSEDRGAN